MLLIMGLATQMIGWPDEFCEGLAGRGFRVVRFDNRDCGRSTHIERTRRPRRWQLVRRRIHSVTYTLSDMADDAVGLMRELGNRARPRRRSLDGRDDRPDAGRRAPGARFARSSRSCPTQATAGGASPRSGSTAFLLRRAPAGPRRGYIERLVALFGAIGSPGFPRNEAAAEGPRGRSWDRGHDPSALRPAARRDHRLGRPHRAATPDHGADARDPRDPRPDGPQVRWSRHQPGDSRRPAGDDRGDGPRPSRGRVAAADRADQRARRMLPRCLRFLRP